MRWGWARGKVDVGMSAQCRRAVLELRRALGRRLDGLASVPVENLARQVLDAAGPPDLVGSSVAAKMLGVPGPHISRLRRAGRLKPVPIEGTADAYLLEEVRELAKVLKRERAARAKQRAK